MKVAEEERSDSTDSYRDEAPRPRDSTSGVMQSSQTVEGGVYISNEIRMVDITKDKPIKVAVKVQVPVRDHPKFNFVGKLLGPKGNSLKRLQEDTMCRMAVLGRGSMKNKQKEEELRTSGDSKFSHLAEDLHIEISAYATPAEAHARIAYALAEVRRFLVPDHNDDIRQEQMWELQILNTQDQGGINATKVPLSSVSKLERTKSAGMVGSISMDNHKSLSTGGRPSLSDTRCLRNRVLPGTTSSLSGRKRQVMASARSTMPARKKSVMSLLAQANAVEKTGYLKSAQLVVGSGSSHQAQATAVASLPLLRATLQLSPCPTNALESHPSPTSHPRLQQQQQQQLKAAETIPPREQPLLHSHVPPLLIPTIHGFLHGQSAATGPGLLPILSEEFMAGISQHRVKNIHIT